MPSFVRRSCRSRPICRQRQAEAAEAEITFDDIAAVIEGWTKIPVHRLTEDESVKLLSLEERIHRRVIGQEEAVDAVSRAIRGDARIFPRKSARFPLSLPDLPVLEKLSLLKPLQK